MRYNTIILSKHDLLQHSTIGEYTKPDLDTCILDAIFCPTNTSPARVTP